MSSVKKACICSFCAAMCYVLPIAFHAAGLGGVFSPMHLPVLLCGLLCGWPYGALCGVVGPVISCVLSGMPSPAQLVHMIPELCVYGLASGMGMKLVRTGKTAVDLYLSLLLAMALGRVAGGVARALFMMGGGESYTLAMWAGAYLIQAIPGIILHLVLLPALVLALTKAGLIPARYPRQMLKGSAAA